MGRMSDLHAQAQPVCQEMFHQGVHGPMVVVGHFS